MIGILSFIAAVSSLSYQYFSALVHRRLREADGESVNSQFILNQPHHFGRYWQLAPNHHWSRAPIVGAVLTFLCGLGFSAAALSVLVLTKRYAE
jgi:hypothetical protein